MKIRTITTEAEMSLEQLTAVLRHAGLLVRNQVIHEISRDLNGIRFTITEQVDQEFTTSGRVFTEKEEKIICSKSLEDLNLSVRAFNCLKASKINSLRQLLDYSEEDLTKFRNFGMKSISEIKEVLTKLGLSLSSN
jgi:DNA-directed RNA polymerase alpha subunit